MDSVAAKRVFRYPLTRRLLDLLAVAGTIAAMALVVWLVVTPVEDPESEGKQFLIIIASPWILGGLLFYLGKMVRDSARRWAGYEVAPGGLRVDLPLKRQTIPWSDIDHFELLPATFPKAPSPLLLHLHSGKQIRIERCLSGFEEFFARLGAYKPHLADYRHDEIHVYGVASQRRRRRRERWARVRDMLMLPLIALFLLPLMLMGYFYVRDYLGYRQLRTAGVAAEGTIVEIEELSQSTSVRIEFTTAAGEQVRIRRSVPKRFEEEHAEGDKIAIVYLPDDPETARIPEWDLDSRRVYLLIYVLPFGWMLFVAGDRMVRKLVSPAHAEVTLTLTRCEEDWHVEIAPHGLETLCRLMPERYSGRPMAFTRTIPKSAKEPVLTSILAKWLKDAGLRHEVIADECILLSSQSTGALLRRLGYEESVTMDHVLVPTDDAGAKLWLLERMAKGELTAEAVGDASLFCISGEVGPLSSDDIETVMHRSVVLMADRVYGQAVPAEAVKDEILQGFHARAREGIHVLSMRRRRRQTELWYWHQDNDFAERMCFRDGRWDRPEARDLPGFMKEGRIRDKLTLVVFAPLLLLSWVVTWIVSPIERWEKRRKLRAFKDEEAEERRERKPKP